MQKPLNSPFRYKRLEGLYLQFSFCKTHNNGICYSKEHFCYQTYSYVSNGYAILLAYLSFKASALLHFIIERHDTFCCAFSETNFYNSSILAELSQK